MTPLRYLWKVGTKAPLLALLFCVSGPTDAGAQPFCGPPALVDVTFAAGTRWRFCWEMRAREGLIINRAFYTARSTPEREVLFRASIAQIHVPYHTGSPRFRDLTIDTSGLGALAVTLTGPECAPGVLLSTQVCREIEGRGYAWKFGGGVGSFLKGQQVRIWNSSQLGLYNYITAWIFKDDGTVEAEEGLTGRLQILGTGAAYAPFGSRVNPEASPMPQYAVSHMHNIYYRFDFDIGGAANDAVDARYMYQYFGPPPSPTTACTSYGQCNADDKYRYTNETYDVRFQPFMSWHVLDTILLNADGRSIGYEIVPIDSGRWDAMTDTTEPWSLGDLFVTTFNGCELLATDNQPPYIPAGCAGAATHVLDMTAEGDPVDGADIVVWYVAILEHHPRDEDQLNMPIGHMGVGIQPRSWRHINTLQP